MSCYFRPEIRNFTITMNGIPWHIDLPPALMLFVLTLVFSLLLGLELRQHYRNEPPGTLYGTDRTLTFIGLLGYVLYVTGYGKPWVYLAGLLVVAAFLLVYYVEKIRSRKQYGITTILVGLLTYGLAPLIDTQPLWLVVALVVVVLILVERKGYLRRLTGRFDEDEFITLAKFLLISGVILPLLPDRPLAPQIPVSPFRIWAAVTVISGISYAGYLIRRFIYPRQGPLITGLLGGLYSSTATGIVLAKRSREAADPYPYASAIVLATGMMFVRIWVLARIFNPPAGHVLSLPLLSLAALAALSAWLLERYGRRRMKTAEKINGTQVNNPLEFRTALIFALLFVVFSLITEYVVSHFGHQGLHLLSFVVGVTDIDPFLLSLFTGKYAIGLSVLAGATLMATLSNNLMKACYALWFGSRDLRKPVLAGFAPVILAQVLWLLFNA